MSQQLADPGCEPVQAAAHLPNLRRPGVRGPSGQVAVSKELGGTGHGGQRNQQRARVGVGDGVVAPGAGVGAWLPEDAADFVAAADEAHGESAPLAVLCADEVVPGVLDEDCGCVRVVAAASVSAAVLTNIITRPTAATRLSRATCQVSRETRSTPMSRRARRLRCFMDSLQHQPG